MPTCHITDLSQWGILMGQSAHTHTSYTVYGHLEATVKVTHIIFISFYFHWKDFFFIVSTTHLYIKLQYMLLYVNASVKAALIHMFV